MTATRHCPSTVFIADFDLYSSSASGAGFYRQLFQRYPAIQFTYFRDNEPEQTPRPPNVTTISALREIPPNQIETADNELWLRPFTEAQRLANAIGAREFDLLEIPLYNAHLLMLPQALKRRGSGFNAVVVSLLERRSRMIELGWDQTQQTLHRGELAASWEKLLFDSADLRYAVSPVSRDDWRKVSSRKVEYLNPLTLFDPAQIKAQSVSAIAAPDNSPPNLVFIGRTERCKGPDLFLELLWQLPRSNYGKAIIIGEPVPTDRWMTSNEWLRQMAKHRDLDVDLVETISPQELARIRAGRTIIVLPSRYEALNPIAIESLLAGCPTVIGTGSDVCRLLSDEMPGLSFARFDPHDMDTSVDRVLTQIRNFEITRASIDEAVRQSRSTGASCQLSEIYQAASDADLNVRAQLAERFAEQHALDSRFRPGFVQLLRSRMLEKISPSEVANWARRRGQTWFVAAYHWSRTNRCRELPENSPEQIRAKIQAMESLVHGERFGRAWVWSELSRLEAKGGRDLVSVAYALRVMRLAGTDRLGQLKRVIEILKQRNFLAEAEVVELLYGSSPLDDRQSRLLKWLDTCREQMKSNSTVEFEKVDDRRAGSQTKVAVIVSLYNAASKIRKFLDSLARQTLMDQRLIELVLVDSGSPVDEYSPISDHPVFVTQPAIYLRTRDRETIQQAWNRGLSIARSPYVTMLGCDETVLPDCLERLSDELDRRPELDWIQANSLIVETDPAGHYERDAGCYDRTCYNQELVRLECCYLSFVGALSRRNLHERFGYYDPSFRGAGDTEFKNRVLPDIVTSAYPKTLGLFWNYPEIRTTQNPLAEIEDYRAWHAHRSAAGVEYAHRKSDPAAIVAAAELALRYRVSHQSSGDTTDLEYACELLTYARRRDPNCFPAELLQEMRKLLEDFRRLDWAGWQGLAQTIAQVRPIVSRMERLNQRLKEQFANQPKLTYYNDERCVHINWCWSYLK